MIIISNSNNYFKYLNFPIFNKNIKGIKYRYIKLFNFRLIDKDH